MKTTVVIPTYWSRTRDEGHKEGDVIYDHPTPVDEEGTLLRTLESMKNLENKKYKLAILLCTTTNEIFNEAEEKVRNIINKANLNIEVILFTDAHLNAIKNLDIAFDSLSMKGYSNVRNMCLFVSHIMGSDVAMLIDDDEVFENPKFIDMAKEHMGTRIYGETIYGVAGYYLNKYGKYYDDVEILPWMTYWDRFGAKGKAFDEIIGKDPVIKKTPFAFGGAMIIHKNLFRTVPFDPRVTRGEDIDYLLNSKMFGYDFFLDNRLSIKHLPPKKNHPIWKRFREDMYRFLYEKAKIDSQKDLPNMRKVLATEFDPYPGEFLKDDLEERIFKTNMMLAFDYMTNGDNEGVKACLENIYMSKYDAKADYDVFDEYVEFQKAWVSLIKVANEKIEDIRKNINMISKSEIDSEELDKYDIIKNIEGFDILNDLQLKEIVTNMNIYNFKENDIIFREGNKNNSVYFVLKGEIRIIKYTEDKDEILIGTIRDNEVIGETTFVNDLYNVNAIADTDVVVTKINKDTLKAMFEDDLDLEAKILKIFLEKMHKKLGNINKLHSELIVKNESMTQY
ncbi:MAG: cyclic nucleotide-binding domain-containing protein [Clostridia bacterium]|jgi:hypothetical protein|nr:cyclic nucleotide-binding domain-containing protein [Clostridia bacterium]